MQRGFSLVELSIVLVIIALLTGGILAGQSLLRASEVRAISTEFSSFQTALYNFQEKYAATPGDMVNATKYFGQMTADSGCLVTTGSTLTDSGACNGNGDGLIDTVFGGAGYIAESFQTWRHLQAAQLIPGDFTGRYSATTSSGECNPAGGSAINCPNSRFVGAQWSLEHRYSPWNGLEVAAYFTVGKALVSGTTTPAAAGGILKANEVSNIDRKMDDGMPGTGIVRVRTVSPNCHSGSGSTATYLLSLAEKACYIEFRTEF